MNNQYSIPPQNENNQGSSDFLGELLGKLLSAQSPNATTEATTEPTVEASASNSSSAGQNPIGDLVSTALSNPELLAKLPMMISAAKPIIEAFSQKGKENDTPSAPAISQDICKSESISKSGYDKRAALLCAMKPYLSVDRQNAIDYIVKLSRLGDILKTL